MASDFSTLILRSPTADLEPAPAEPGNAERDELAARLMALSSNPTAAPSELSFGFLAELPEILARSPFKGPRDPRAAFFSSLGGPLLWDPKLANAWLDAIEKAGLTGRPEAPSPMAASLPVSPIGSVQPPPADTPALRESLSRWMAAGMIRWDSASEAARFARPFPGLLANELGARSLSRFLPPSRSELPSGEPGLFGRVAGATLREPDFKVLCALVECGVFFRLAQDYEAADPRAFLRGLGMLLDSDVELAQNNRDPLPSLDPVYDQLRQWSAGRIASRLDWVTVYGDPHAGGNRPHRADNFLPELRALSLSLCRAQIEAEALAAISQAASPEPRPPSPPRPSL